MRVRLLGSSPAVEALAALVNETRGLTRVDHVPQYTITIQSGSVLALDSVDSPIERHLEAMLEELGSYRTDMPTRYVKTRVGGNRNPRAVVVTCPDECADAVAHACYFALLKIAKHGRSAWWQWFGAVLLVLAVASSASAQSLGNTTKVRKVAFANLGTPANGTVVFCTDCTPGTNPATGGGSGAFAFRQGDVWVAIDGGGGGGGAPTTATYVTQTPDGTLSNEQALSLLTTGLLKNTTTTGVLSVYGGSSCTNQFVRSLDASGSATCNSVAGTDFASQTANTFFAAPNGSAGTPTFRAIVAADVPTLNQNTSGTASNVTGTVAIANGGTGQTTNTAAFDALAPASASKGDLLVFDGTDWVKQSGGVIGKFLRYNTTTSTNVDWAPGPNISSITSPQTNSSNTTATVVNIGFSPAANTWFGVTCNMVYRSAATTTGIGIALYANNNATTAPPQSFYAHYEFSGFGAAGTDDTWGQSSSSNGTLVITTGVNALNTDYLLHIEAVIQTHATATDAFIVPLFRSEVNLSTVTIQAGSYCIGYVLS